MKYFILMISIACIACSNNSSHTSNADKMIEEAMANAKKLEQEAEAKAAKTIAEVEQKVQQEIEEKAAEKKRKNAESMAKSKAAEAALYIPGSISKMYNGFYLNDNNNENVLLVMDGHLWDFKTDIFKTITKTGYYVIDKVDDAHTFHFKSQIFVKKNREKAKATVLSDVQAILEGGKVKTLHRAGRNYVRVNTFNDFLKTKRTNTIQEIKTQLKTEEGLSENQIHSALSNLKFYKHILWREMPLHGKAMPISQIIKLLSN